MYDVLCMTCHYVCSVIVYLCLSQCVYYLGVHLCVCVFVCGSRSAGTSVRVCMQGEGMNFLCG